MKSNMVNNPIALLGNQRTMSTSKCKDIIILSICLYYFKQKTHLTVSGLTCVYKTYGLILRHTEVNISIAL